MALRTPSLPASQPQPLTPADWRRRAEGAVAAAAAALAAGDMGALGGIYTDLAGWNARHRAFQARRDLTECVLAHRPQRVDGWVPGFVTAGSHLLDWLEREPAKPAILNHVGVLLYELEVGSRVVARRVSAPAAGGRGLISLARHLLEAQLLGWNRGAHCRSRWCAPIRLRWWCESFPRIQIRPRGRRCRAPSGCPVEWLSSSRSIPMPSGRRTAGARQAAPRRTRPRGRCDPGGGSSDGVPVMQDAVLVQALDALELGFEVPPELYRAVAEALLWAYRLTGRAAPVAVSP